jgi:hypothetical protein
MSQENVEVVARLMDAWNHADVDAMLALVDPECEVIPARGTGAGSRSTAMPSFENWRSSTRSRAL